MLIYTKYKILPQETKKSFHHPQGLLPKDPEHANALTLMSARIKLTRSSLNRSTCPLFRKRQRGRKNRIKKKL